MDYKKSQFCNKILMIFISRHFDFGKNLKKKSTFPKEFFNDIWLGEHEYIYITGITFKKLFRFKMATKTFFDIAQ